MPILTKTPANRKTYTTFSPKSVSCCVLWLDGADPAGTGTPPSSGETVSTWTDKSTSAKNATSGGTPTYVSGGGVNFDGSSFFYNLSFAQNLSQRSIFIIMQETTHLRTRGVFPLIPNPSTFEDWTTTTGMTIETSSGLRFYGNVGQYSSDIGNSTLLVKAIYNDNMNATTGSGYLNGTNAANVTATYTAGTCSGYGVGARWPGSTSMNSGLNGVIYEILFFNTPLGTTDRQSIEGYLAQKWSLTGSLPAGHPGLTQNFLTTSTTPSDRITLIPRNQPINYGIVYGIPYLIFYITSGLVYHLDAGNPLSYSGSGSTWTDLAGSGISMTLYGSPSYSSANGGYLSFVPSSSQYGSTSTSLAAASTWTIEVFIYYNGTNTGGLPCIFTDTFPGSTNTIQWALGSLAGGGNTALQAGYYSGWNVTPAQSPLTSGNWYHIIGTYDGTNIKLYINGSINQTTASATTPTRNTAGHRIMRRWDNSDYWGGNLAVLRLYNRALSSTEVSQNYSAQKDRFGL